MTEAERAERERAVSGAILQRVDADHQRAHAQFNAWLAANGLLAVGEQDRCVFVPWTDRGAG